MDFKVLIFCRIKGEDLAGSGESDIIINEQRIAGYSQFGLKCQFFKGRFGLRVLNEAALCACRINADTFIKLLI